MLTLKAFSTISYNTPAFLQQTLDSQLKRGIIDFYAFIEHLPEEDETKKHIHLFVIPSCKIDTITWCNAFKEIDLIHASEKPLGVIRPRSSKFLDWYLYAIHDENYLKTKLETRKYHYSDEELIVSDSDYFNELKHESFIKNENRQVKILDMLAHGVDLFSLLADGLIPIQQLSGYAIAQQLWSENKRKLYKNTGCNTFRGVRKNHEKSKIITDEIDTFGKLPFKG